MLSLFSAGALVHSPLYGPAPATDFFWFHFGWRLPGGRPAPFDVVDVLELDAEERIAALRIVYDTVSVRPAFKEETGKRSWRETPPAAQ